MLKQISANTSLEALNVSFLTQIQYFECRKLSGYHCCLISALAIIIHISACSSAALLQFRPLRLSALLHCRGLIRWHLPDGTRIGSRTALQSGGVAAAPSIPPAEEPTTERAQTVEPATPECVPSGEHSSSGLPAVGPDSTQGVEPEALPPAAESHVGGEPAGGASPAAAADAAVVAGGGSFLQRLLGAPPSMHAAALSQDGTVLYTGAAWCLRHIQALPESDVKFCFGSNVWSM